MMPLAVEIDLVEGRTVACSVDAVIGSPAHPLTADAAHGKFERCWRAVAQLSYEQGVALRSAVSALEAIEDVRLLATLTAPPRSS